MSFARNFLVVFHWIDPPNNSQNFLEKAHYPNATPLKISIRTHSIPACLPLSLGAKTLTEKIVNSIEIIWPKNVKDCLKNDMNSKANHLAKNVTYSDEAPSAHKFTKNWQSDLTHLYLKN